ncbi:MAG: hypothetical protein JJU02_12920 [Cryomorphaceae bacterium]|nr:hypothetical protein [Cryomorphaceae bacterium]
MIKRTVVFLWLLSFGGLHAQTCDEILNDKAYFSYRATAETVEAARSAAQDFLLNQITTTVKSVTELKTKEISGEVSQEYVSTGRMSSNLRLSGLRHVVCENQRRRDDDVTVVVYISLDDLEKSAREVENQVQQYLEMMEMKKLLDNDILTDAYTAYLLTFLSPMNISATFEGNKIRDARSFLEILLKQHLRDIDLSLAKPRPGGPGMEEQFSVEMNVIGSNQTDFVYEFYSSTLNSRAQLPRGKGTFHFIIQPSAPKERYRGYLSFSPLRIDPNVRDAAEANGFSKEVSIEFDFSDIIEVDFNIREQGENVIASPVLKHLSPRTFEWFSNGKLISTDQILRVPKDEIQGSVKLVVNGLTSHAKEQTVRGAPIQTVQTDKKPEITTEQEVRSVSLLGSELGKLQNFSDLQNKLRSFRQNGQATWGRQNDFVNPDQCWVIMVDGESQKLIHVLTPNQDGRKDLKTGKVFQQIDEQFNGYAQIWIDLF